MYQEKISFQKWHIHCTTFQFAFIQREVQEIILEEWLINNSWLKTSKTTFKKYKHSQVTCMFIEMLIRRFPTIASAAPMKMFCRNNIITMWNYIQIIIYFQKIVAKFILSDQQWGKGSNENWFKIIFLIEKR